ncbi:MAG: DUF2723 domain-containing protein [Candidatus Latescibacteria bacterium]|nr:DUF2723 domain-containing protein [Candidatus Latescibacterota bacterium]
MLAPDWYRRPTFLIAAGIFVFATIVYCLTMSQTLNFWDCGEYITTAHTMGVPHQPGTPLYVLVGRFFDVLLAPLTGTAAAVNFMSAFFSALALVFVYLTIQELARRADPDSGWLPHVGGVVGALFLLFSDTYWTNAIEAEVYGLAAFVIAFLTWLGLKWYDLRAEPHSDRLLYLVIYLLGLGVGFHLGTLLVYPGFFLLILMARGRRLALVDLVGVSVGLGLFLLSTMVKDDVVIVGGLVLLLSYAVWRAFGGKPFILIGCGVFLLGLSVHLILLIRAGLDPALNNTQPDNFQTLMSVLRREQYPPIDPLVRKADLWWQIRYYYGFLLDQFSFLDLGSLRLTRLLTILVPIFLGLLGAIHGFFRCRPWFWMLLVNYLINADILNLYLNFSDSEVRARDYFFGTGFMYFALFIGLGTAALLRYLSGPLAARTTLNTPARAGKSAKGPQTAPSRDLPPARIGRATKVAAVALVLVAALPALAPGNQKWYTHDRTENRVAHEYAWNLLAGLDPGAIVFTNGDNDTYPLWYLQEVEGFRRDVTVVNLALINLPWYIKQMKRRTPPMPVSYDDTQVEQLRPVLYEDPDTGKREVVYVRDYIVHDIIQNRGERPVFFAVTIPQENMARYFTMLQMEGLAYRFTGVKGQDGMPTVDSDRLLANCYGIYDFSATLDGDSERRRSEFRALNGLPPTPSPEGRVREVLGERDWRFDGLWRHNGRHREDVHFDRNSENLLGNYPAGLIRAGYDYIMQAQQPGASDAFYDEMIARAENAFELASSFDPTFPMVTDIYPMVLIERGRARDAVAHVQRIHGMIPPRDEQAMIPQLVQAMVQRGEDATAIAWMEQRLRDDPRDAVARQQLDALRAAGSAP